MGRETNICSADSIVPRTIGAGCRPSCTVAAPRTSPGIVELDAPLPSAAAA